MNKILFSAFPYPSQTVVFQSVQDPSDQMTVVHGFEEKPPKLEEVRPRIVREVLQALLIHDVVAIPIHGIGDLVQVFGAEDSLRMLQRGCFELIGDNGLTPVLRQLTRTKYSVDFLADGDPSIKGTASLNRLEKRLLTLTPNRERVSSFVLYADAHQKSIDTEGIRKTLEKEAAYDLQNRNLTAAQNIVATDPKSISPSDGFKVLRLLFLNKSLVLSHACGATSIASDGIVHSVLNQKLSPVAQQGHPQTISLFNRVMTDKGIPDLGSLYLAGVLPMEAFLDLRDNSQGQRFREWFFGTGYDPVIVQQILLSKKIEQRMLTKWLRFIVPNAIGVANNAAGLIASAIDSFIVQKLVGGWHPNIFLDDVLKAEVDNRVRANAASLRRNEIKKRFPTTERNDRCPCDSGKKFKHCCGLGM